MICGASNSFSLILVLNVFNASAFYVCFPAYVLGAFVGPSGEHEWSTRSRRDGMSGYRTKISNNIKEQKTNQTIIPITRGVTETEPYVQSEVRSRSHLEADRDLLSGRSRSDCWVRSRVPWFVFTPAQKVRTSDFFGLVRTKQGT